VIVCLDVCHQTVSNRYSSDSFSLIFTKLATRGVVVPERGGVPFRQIFLSRNGAPANIVYHRQNADTAAFRQISSGRGPALSILTYLNVSL